MQLIIPPLILLLLIAAYGFFITLTLALSRASASLLEKALEDGVWGSKLAVQLIDKADQHIIAAHAGRFFCAFGVGVTSLLVYQGLLPIKLELFDWANGTFIGFILAVLIILVVAACSVLAVQVAKSIAVHNPEKVLLTFGWFCSLFTRVMLPIRALVNGLVVVLEKSGKLKKPPSERELTFSAEDLETVIEHSTQAGTLADSESELLQGALRLSELKVREIMTPRADIVSVGLESSVEELRDIVGEAGFSRVLVTGEQLDDVRGMILAKDLIPFIGKESFDSSISTLVREVLFVDGELSGDEVLKKLRASQAHLAIVTDEHGGVDGIVTLEDLLEEIVGDIFDETDVFEEEQDVVVTTTGELIVDGGTSLSDLETDHGVELPEGEYDTVAGFIIHELGRIPEEGESVQCNGSLLLVEQVDENRITQLRIQPEIEVGEGAQSS